MSRIVISRTLALFAIATLLSPLARVTAAESHDTEERFPRLVATSSKVPKPRIVSREEWGSKAQPIGEDRKQVPKWITIHHAGELWHDKDDPVEFVRHMQVWGQKRPQLEKPPRDTYWPDLPYHFLIAPDGRIFEGRPTQYEPESNLSLIHI